MIIKGWAGIVTDEKDNDVIDFSVDRDTGKQLMSIYFTKKDALEVYECVRLVEIKIGKDKNEKLSRRKN